MALTVSDIQERARSRYNATNDKFFSDQFLRDCIFEAQSELAKEGWVIENTLTTDSIANTREYAYPENTLSIKEVRYDYNKIYKVPLRNDPKSSTSDPTGTPRNYAIWDNVIVLYDTPDEDGKVIQIRVYSYPQDVTSNLATIEVPQEFREDLIQYCLAQMAMKDQNTALYDRFMNRWEQTIAKAKMQRKKRLRSDRPARVKDEYFGNDVPITVDEVAYRGFTL